MNIRQSDDFYDIWFLACDNHVYGSHDEGVHIGNDVDHFIMDELVPVAIRKAKTDFKIIDDKGDIIRPFHISGKELYLGPKFFGKNFRLQINGKKTIALTVKFWKKCTMPKMLN